MEYVIHKLAKLAGVSTRTLRFYDEIGLLKPARINSSGYRVYGPNEVDRLQQIMFYRELGVGLEEIKKILSEPNFDSFAALKDHHRNLLEKKAQLERLIENVTKTIASRERKITMADKEKFEAFKRQMIEENEDKYGKEVRKKYGAKTVEESNAKLMKMSPEEHEKVTRLAEQVTETLARAFKVGDPASALAQQTADLHKQWISFYWNEYSKEAHAALAQMYVDDKRFTSYYDKEHPGTAEFLRDAILIYTGMRK